MKSRKDVVYIYMLCVAFMQYLNMTAARAARCQLDFKRYRPVPPEQLGTFTVEASVEELLPYIDWKPFFEVWQLRGKYPNRGFPKIFQDKTVGEEAARLYEDARRRLTDLSRSGALKVCLVCKLNTS